MAISKFPQKLAQKQYISGPVTLGGGGGGIEPIYIRAGDTGGQVGRERKRKKERVSKY